MKKKGYTLIELLAVIVILAIIALIITPVITGIINLAKERSDKLSAEGYYHAAKNFCATTLIDPNKKSLLATNILEHLEVTHGAATGSIIVYEDCSVDMDILINNRQFLLDKNEPISVMRIVE